MKAFFICLLLIGVAWKVYEDYGDSLPGFPQQADMREDFTLIKDAQGRELSCKLLAKDQEFVVIEREADGQTFLVNVADLSERSRKRIKSQGNFNSALVDDRLFAAAKTSLKVELQYVPDLNYFNCSLGNLRQKSCTGLEVDRFRDFLRAQGIAYRETSLPTRPAGNNRVYLPDGVKTVPCVKIGDARLYSRSESELKKLMAEAYVIQDYFTN